MQSPDDKYIMDRVRMTLEGYQPECTPQSWAKMSALLDQQATIDKTTNWRVWLNGFICGLLVSLVFIGSYIVLTIYNSSKEKYIGIAPVANPKVNNLISYSLSSRQMVENYNDVKNLRSTSKLELSLKNLEYAKFNRIDNVKTIEESRYESRYDKNNLSYEINNNEEVIGLRSVEESNDFQKITPISAMQLFTTPVLESDANRICINRPVFCFSKKKEKERSKLFNWGKFDFSFKIQDDLYKNFVGPDRVKVSYSPEIIFGSFQSKSGIGQGAGIVFEGPISSSMSLGLGIYKREYNWQKEKVFRSLKQNILPDSSYKYVVDSIHISKGRWKYFEVPFVINMHLLKQRKSEIILSTSICAVIMQSERYQFDRIVDQNTISQVYSPKPYSNYSIIGNIGVGIEYRYRMNERWSFWASPNYKWYIKGMGDTHFKPQCFGVNFGIIYQFNLHRRK